MEEREEEQALEEDPTARRHGWEECQTHHSINAYFECLSVAQLVVHL